MYGSIDELDPFDAAERVAAHIREARRAVPLLPPSAGGLDVLRERIGSLTVDGLGSVDMQESGREFLGAFPVDDFRGRRAAFSPYWAHATAGGRFSPEMASVEALYEDAAARWVADGCRVHLIELAGPDPPCIEAWSWLGFAPQAVDAVRGVDPIEPTGVPVRRADAAELARTTDLESRLQDHLGASPVFLAHTFGIDARTWEQKLTDPDYGVWLAGEGDRADGYLVIGPASDRASDIVMDPGTAGITGAFTVQDRRREGVATALLAAAVDWARERGFERVGVDFEPMNPPARRFWLRHFEIVALTVGRSLDPHA